MSASVRHGKGPQAQNTKELALALQAHNGSQPLSKDVIAKLARQHLPLAAQYQWSTQLAF